MNNIQPVTKTIRKQKPSHQHFRFGVFSPDAAHVVGTGSVVVHIGHGKNSFGVKVKS